MELKPGDKVRFLNEKGGGIVTGLISTTMVNVAIEEGFVVPVLVKDLIIIEPQGAADRFFDRQVKVNLPERTAAVPEKAKEPTPSHETGSDDRISYLFRQSGIRAIEGIYMAFAPHDQQWLISGNLDIFLVNNTGYDALFSFSLMEDDKGYAGVDYDMTPPYSKLLLETISREDIESWSDGVMQVIFHKNEISPILSPLHAAFKIKPVRFYKETSYQDFPLIGLKAVLINLGDLAGQVIISSTETFAKSGIDPAAKQKLSALTPDAVIDIHKTAPFEAEVDLHISALRQDYTEMPQNEILIYQLDYFTRMLESAIAHNYAKVTFIHGIGNGILKTAIKSRLAGYDHLEIRNAPFAKFGYGAVEVVISQKGI
ncbi:MAG: DUF2027 domain-containing protein [Bacteroidota bacterium]